MKLMKLAAAVALALCCAVPARADPTLQTVLKRGEFLAGITSDSPPSAFLDAQGHQVGFCADVARYLSRRLGVKLTFVPVTAASRIPLLTTGRIDAEIAVTTPQKVRNEVVDFTYSYIWDNAALLVKAGASTNVSRLPEPHQAIGATQGDGFVDRWKQVSPDAKFQFFREPSDVVGALRKGDADAAIVNQTGGRRLRARRRAGHDRAVDQLAGRDHGPAGQFQVAQLAELGAAAHVGRRHVPEALREMVRRGAEPTGSATMARSSRA